MECSAGAGRRYSLGATLAIAALAAGVATRGLIADGTVTGHARFERVKGRPALGYAELYESNLFLSPDAGFTFGPAARLGAPAGQPPRGDGYYSLTVPAGTWSILVNQPLFFIRPRVVPGVTVRDGQTTTVNVELPIDYSTYFTDDGQWTAFEERWYQTFVAGGTSITGVAWKLAGTNANIVEASIRADNGDPNPINWPRAAPAASKTDDVAPLADNWVRWRSGEVPTVPGRRYALRLTGVSGGDRKFAVFFRRKDAQSYAGGQAYSAGGAAQPFDLNATVFSDSDGTAVLHNRTAVGLGELRDGFYGGRWGQTFTATAGTSLAAADVWAAGADNRWDLDFTFRVFRGAPGGAQVGPAKTTRAAFQAFGAGLHGVSYSPGEVPLEPGGLYYIEFTSSPGFNPYINDAGGDAHAGGDAYQDRSLRAGVDLSMTIIVHTEPGGALAGRVTDAATGNGIPGATVTVVEIGRSAAAAADGSYEIRDLPAGAYSVRAANGGYAAASRAGVRITVGETAVADFALAAEPCAGAFMNSSFEAGLGGWTRYGDARDRTVDTSGGGWFAGITARDGIRFHGNEINGCCLSGGLYQQACAVPGRRYLVSAWSNIYWLQGSADDATSRIGVDPGGGTDPNGPVVWSPRHRQPVSGREEWTRLEIEAQAAGPLLTVFLDFRQLPATGNQWRINCFDLVEVEDLDSEPPPPGFRRGDCDTSGDGEITDAIFLLNFLFLGGNAPGCADACDANDDGELNITDASFLLNFLFLGGPPPPPPGAGECGPDAPGPAPDLLACEAPAC